MEVLKDSTDQDQPWAQATTVRGGADVGKEKFYLGYNDLAAPGGRTATVDLSPDAGSVNPNFDSIRIERRSTSGQNGPQIRPVVHDDGTVYAVFYGWRTFSSISKRVRADVVVVRDDSGGADPDPFAALVDDDNFAGVRVARDITFTWNATLGQQRVGGDLSIAVDPNDSSTVYLAWADQRVAGHMLHIQRSTDRGATWSQELLTITNGKNPALAINSESEVGLLYQQVADLDTNPPWETHLRRTTDGLAWNDLLLATTPATTPSAIPPQGFQPYLGDYDYLMAVGQEFYGIFSANNRPDLANFPNEVSYQRNADFDSRRLLARDGDTPVPISIDPFFFKVP